MKNQSENVVRGTVIDVPFSEKEEAKKLGARWDPDMKRWFIPKGVDSDPFEKWIATDKE